MSPWDHPKEIVTPEMDGKIVAMTLDHLNIKVLQVAGTVRIAQNKINR